MLNKKRKFECHGSNDSSFSALINCTAWLLTCWNFIMFHDWHLTQLDINFCAFSFIWCATGWVMISFCANAWPSILAFRTIWCKWMEWGFFCRIFDNYWATWLEISMESRNVGKIIELLFESMEYFFFFLMKYRSKLRNFLLSTDET